VFSLLLQLDCVVLVLLVWCYDRSATHSNVVFSLMPLPVCVVLVVLVWCYDRSATDISLIAMSCFH
jgi:hypothetical protein